MPSPDSGAATVPEEGSSPDNNIVISETPADALSQPLPQPQPQPQPTARPIVMPPPSAQRASAAVTGASSSLRGGLATHPARPRAARRRSRRGCDHGRGECLLGHSISSMSTCPTASLGLFSPHPATQPRRPSPPQPAPTASDSNSGPGPAAMVDLSAMSLAAAAQSAGSSSLAPESVCDGLPVLDLASPRPRAPPHEEYIDAHQEGNHHHRQGRHPARKSAARGQTRRSGRGPHPADRQEEEHLTPVQKVDLTPGQEVDLPPGQEVDIPRGQVDLTPDQDGTLSHRGPSQQEDLALARTGRPRSSSPAADPAQEGRHPATTPDPVHLEPRPAPAPATGTVGTADSVRPSTPPRGRSPPRGDVLATPQPAAAAAVPAAAPRPPAARVILFDDNTIPPDQDTGRPAPPAPTPGGPAGAPDAAAAPVKPAIAEQVREWGAVGPTYADLPQILSAQVYKPARMPTQKRVSLPAEPATATAAATPGGTAAAGAKKKPTAEAPRRGYPPEPSIQQQLVLDAMEEPFRAFKESQAASGMVFVCEAGSSSNESGGAGIGKHFFPNGVVSSPSFIPCV
ncbi:hypothetical protein PAPYR_2262 [Paratrimastix pyriformis]|uniref:Uncharacterized protein n=1 Tax=Paratrimastix pyriformis TaxID=342808 RepID=A0ABQ8UPZ0_9EUKA|nr:hypothetical protein PAPYR_2262 [Paratrimastix pyriformis]